MQNKRDEEQWEACNQSSEIPIKSVGNRIRTWISSTNRQVVVIGAIWRSGVAISCPDVGIEEVRKKVSRAVFSPRNEFIQSFTGKLETLEGLPGLRHDAADSG